MLPLFFFFPSAHTMAAFVFKVFTLSLKTVAKPLAGRFQTYVLNHPTFRGQVIELAQVRGREGEERAVHAGTHTCQQLPSTFTTHSPPSHLITQRLHRMQVAVDRGATEKAGRAFVPPLTEEKAVELAGKVASEGFVWATAISVLGLEYTRQSRKDAEKKAAEAAFRAAVLASSDGATATATAAAAAARAAAEAAADIGARLDAVEHRVRVALEAGGEAAATARGGVSAGEWWASRAAAARE